MLKILSLHLGLGVISVAINNLLVPNPVRWVLCVLFSIFYFVAGLFCTKRTARAAAPLVSLLPFLSRLLQIILGSIMFSHKIISDLTIIPYGGAYAFTLATVDLLYTGHAVSAWFIRILGYLSPGLLILMGYYIGKKAGVKPVSFFPVSDKNTKKLILWRLLTLPIGYALECAIAALAVYILKITPKTGLVVGAASGIITAAVLYFLAGFKYSEASIPKISMWYFLWTVTLLVTASVLKSRILSLAAGGFLLFAQINYFMPAGAEVLCSVLAFILEFFFLASGVLLRRHLDKKKL